MDRPKNQIILTNVPKKCRDGQQILFENAFSTQSSFLNLAPLIIIKNFIFGTFVRANPYKQFQTP